MLFLFIFSLFSIALSCGSSSRDGDSNTVLYIKVGSGKKQNVCTDFQNWFLLFSNASKRERGTKQGWEFAHLISERIACFLPKNERISALLKKMSDSLIRSFLVSDRSYSLTIAHFLWAAWANCSWSLIFGERPDWFAHIAHLSWTKWAIHSHRSPKKRNERKLAICKFFQIFFILNCI